MTCKSAHEQSYLSNDTIDSVLRHREVEPARITPYSYTRFSYNFFLQGEYGLMDIKPKHVANLFGTIKYVLQYNSCAKPVFTVYFNSRLISESCIRINMTRFWILCFFSVQTNVTTITTTTTTTTTTNNNNNNNNNNNIPNKPIR